MKFWTNNLWRQHSIRRICPLCLQSPGESLRHWDKLSCFPLETQSSIQNDVNAWKAKQSWRLTFIKHSKWFLVHLNAWNQWRNRCFTESNWWKWTNVRIAIIIFIGYQIVSLFDRIGCAKCLKIHYMIPWNPTPFP